MQNNLDDVLAILDVRRMKVLAKKAFKRQVMGHGVQSGEPPPHRGDTPAARRAMPAHAGSLTDPTAGCRVIRRPYQATHTHTHTHTSSLFNRISHGVLQISEVAFGKDSQVLYAANQDGEVEVRVGVGGEAPP